MGEKTGIAWTDKTWNPWMGCRKVSAGCKNCYMFRDMKRYGENPNMVRRSKTIFYDPLNCWIKPAKVFACSWSDFFIEEADEWRPEAWEIIRKTPHLTYQILTKRPENIAARLPADWGEGYPNVWLGVSVENQEAADERIPVLLLTPARTRFLSCEPLLEDIELGLFGRANHYYCDGGTEDDPAPIHRCLSPIHWVICGGESGPGFRAMDLDWARSLRDQCVAAGVPFFFKQTSGVHPDKSSVLDGKVWREFPGTLGG